MKRFFFALLCLVIALPVFSKPKVALVLSGGGAKGCAHIPIIKELERRGIYPDFIVGTSMGGLVGGLYAAGYSGEELEKFVLENDINSAINELSTPTNIEKDRPYSIFDSNVYSLANQPSLIDDRDVNKLIHKAIYKTESFDDVSIPFYAITMDARNSKEITLSSGSLFEALRSTMSIPILFTPFYLSSGVFVSDGGAVMNLGASKAKELGADIIIGVDVIEDTRLNVDPKTLASAVDSYVATMAHVNVQKEYKYIDYLIIPELAAFPFMDYSKSAEIMAAGEEYVTKHKELFDEIEQRVGKSDKKPMPYSEKSADVISSFYIPPELASYSKLFEKYIGAEYNESIVSEISNILSSIKDWKGLYQLSYTFLDGCIRLNMVEGEKSDKSLSIGLVNGPILSLTADYKHAFLGVSLGQKALVKIGYEFTPSLSLAVKGAYGGISAISTWFLENRIPTSDFSVGGELTFKKRAYRDTHIYLGGGFDYYMLGRERTSDGTKQLWKNEKFFLPYGYVSGRFKKDFSFMETETQFDLQLGFRNNLVYQFKADTMLTLPVTRRGAVKLSALVFSSRFPYELSASYYSDDFGILNRDYLSLRLQYEYSMLGKNGPSVSIGPFVSGGEKDKAFDISDEKTDISFKYLEKIRFGLFSEIGYTTSFGYYAVSFAFSQDGLLSLRLKFR
ncbi:MAG: patatin-like phospholipase family protein [Sphaerochaetaceae bacterium]|nr:patatin-like phospholipase family protein [Sphaerochaetaceae bacterium]